MSVIYKKILYNNNTLYFHPLIIYHITCLPICCNLLLPICLYVRFFCFVFAFFFLMLRLLVHGWCCLLIFILCFCGFCQKKTNKERNNWHYEWTGLSNFQNVQEEYLIFISMWLQMHKICSLSIMRAKIQFQSSTVLVCGIIRSMLSSC